MMIQLGFNVDRLHHVLSAAGEEMLYGRIHHKRVSLETPAAEIYMENERIHRDSAGLL